MKKVLYYFTQKHNGNWEKIYNSLEEKEMISKDQYFKFDNMSNYLCLIDAEYPNALKTIYKPPFSIFIYGKKELLSKKFLLGIYGNPTNKNVYSKLLEFKNVIFVLDFDNKKLINYFIQKKINFIAICKYGLNQMDKELFDNIISNGNLILTEMPNENKNEFNDQLHNRFIFGLTKKMLFLDDKSNKLFNTIIEFCKLEDVSCFSFKESECKVIKKINNLNNIFINCFLS